jgi:hypothetical protein
MIFKAIFAGLSIVGIENFIGGGYIIEVYINSSLIQRFFFTRENVNIENVHIKYVFEENGFIKKFEGDISTLEAYRNDLFDLQFLHMCNGNWAQHVKLINKDDTFGIMSCSYFKRDSFIIETVGNYVELKRNALNNVDNIFDLGILYHSSSFHLNLDCNTYSNFSRFLRMAQVGEYANCKPFVYMDKNFLRIGIFALCSIYPGEEIILAHDNYDESLFKSYVNPPIQKPYYSCDFEDIITCEASKPPIFSSNNDDLINVFNSDKIPVVSEFDDDEINNILNPEFVLDDFYGTLDELCPLPPLNDVKSLFDDKLSDFTLEEIDFILNQSTVS